jgi:hypothetical protein
MKRASALASATAAPSTSVGIPTLMLNVFSIFSEQVSLPTDDDLPRHRLTEPGVLGGASSWRWPARAGRSHGSQRPAARMTARLRIGCIDTWTLTL